MTTKELIDEIATRTECSKVNVKAVLDTMKEVAIEQMKECGEVKIVSGITLYGTTREAHVARNPRTGESVEVPSKITCKARFGNHVKNAVNE